MSGIGLSSVTSSCSENLLACFDKDQRNFLLVTFVFGLEVLAEAAREGALLLLNFDIELVNGH